MQKVPLKFTAFLGVDVGKKEVAVCLRNGEKKLGEAVFCNTSAKPILNKVIFWTCLMVIYLDTL